MKYFIGGCGLTGAVIAERIANVLKQEVVIFEARAEIGGNCAAFFEPETGIECHRYGSHIFHISDQTAIDYISRFCALNGYRHQVLARHDGTMYFMPVNLMTINQFYHSNFSPAEAAAFIKAERGNWAGQTSLEARAIAQIGRPLYDAFIRAYTIKQWGQDPAHLPASILRRLEFRTSYDCAYFGAPFQGLPLAGYGSIFQKLTANPLIKIFLKTDLRAMLPRLPKDAVIIHTGMPDALFSFRYGKLAWRSLRFEWENLPLRDYQGCAVVNFVDSNPAWTRIHEFKHFHPERRAIYAQAKTTICREYPLACGEGREAFYPVNDQTSNTLHEKYRLLAHERGIILAGRLGAYRYLDMGEAIVNALETFESLRKSLRRRDWPKAAISASERQG